MSAKTSPARRAAFFKALGETGNYTIAAAHAKVSRSWVTLHKTNDAEFRAACEDAVAGAAAQAQARAAAGGSDRPSAKWGYIDGEEMVVRAGNGRRAVVARARLRQWTPRVEARFLGVLAASANVKLACEAAGLSVASAYVRRSKWPGFAERWKAALENGYVRLEFAMIEHACNTFEPVIEFEPDLPMPPMGVDDALQVLRLHRHGVRGVGKPLRQLRVLPSIEAVQAEIERKVAALRRGRAAGLKFRGEN
ncbi:hypothetical protein [Sphingomonas sp. SUN039]|uniref:hypothetical protein n=1 Tax=Sphingomonas sp. SUN039 TaxID=2937787 RepID=UPI0021642511|nr:hypothetical protein [Sphingomonas sp. SUN039]UVO55495.1 hypothetical protein M0209_15715 [Sphingomonas sp. SUN039]